jgi:hypothetical protein
MKPFRVALTLIVALAVALVIGFPLGTQSQEKTIKIGLIFDFSGTVLRRGVAPELSRSQARHRLGQ